MYYKPKHFSVKELVSKRHYELYGEKSLRSLDAGLLIDLDIIREAVYGITGQGIIVNDWAWGGHYHESGLRTKGDKYYNPESGHSYGRAFDIKLVNWLNGDFGEYDADWLRGLIIELKEAGKLQYLSEVEMKTDQWVHVGSRNNPPNHKNLFVFNP